VSKENFHKGILNKELLPDYWELPATAEETFQRIK
jgi:hypothetical protein